MNFIPVDKMKKLREAARNGDERAKKIIAMQLGGKEDFGPLMNDYFSQPLVEETSTGAVEEKHESYGLKKSEIGDGLKKFLEFNGINEDSPDYQSYVDDYYKENPNEKPVENGLGEAEEECETKKQLEKVRKEEIDAIDSYSKAITVVMNDTTISPNKKKKIISRFKEIRGDEEEHAREIDELLSMCNSEEENLEGTVE